MLTSFEYMLLIIMLIYAIWNEFEKAKIIKEMRKRYKGLAGGRKRHARNSSNENNQRFIERGVYGELDQNNRYQKFRQNGQDSW